MKTSWHVRRSGGARDDGDRRWDYAYQFLLQWAMEHNQDSGVWGGLSEDERLFRDSVNEFADHEVRPRVRDMDDHQKFDPALLAQLFELGVMGIEIPDEFTVELIRAARKCGATPLVGAAANAATGGVMSSRTSRTKL